MLARILQGEENVRTKHLIGINSSNLIKVHVTQKNNYCSELGTEPRYPDWLHMVSHVNHLLLILNSSVNILIYCLTGQKYAYKGKGRNINYKDIQITSGSGNICAAESKIDQIFQHENNSR